MTFKTQADIQRYLLEEEGRKVQSTRSNEIFGYIDGSLWNITVNRVSPVNFSIPKDWQPYQEPLPWYETAESGTVLCWFWGRNADMAVLAPFKRMVYDRYGDSNGHSWKHCRPLTPAEIEPFLEAAVRVCKDVSETR